MMHNPEMLTEDTSNLTVKTITLDGSNTTIKRVVGVAANRLAVVCTTEKSILNLVEASHQVVENAVQECEKVYGVTTGFGGMANEVVPSELAAASQNNLLAFLASGAGNPIDRRHVRAAMLLRANVLLKGCSGVRLEIIERLIQFLQEDVTPVVRELGSIGASGDLVPLSAIARAITGQTDFVNVQLGDQIVDGKTALEELNLEPLELLPKEGLAIVNGTSFSSAIAANAIHESENLMALTLGTQALMMRALLVHESPFKDFVHQCKPHPGQVWTAQIAMRLLAGGSTKSDGLSDHVQDRYSLRCLPQYLGSIVEGIARVHKVVETEMNSVSDNPLIDPDSGEFYQSGNFLGQYIGIAMDDLRRYLGLMAKHLDVQIANLVTPEFNSGLSSSLRGNDDVAYNMGLKGLQITGNSIMPLLTCNGNPLVEHFPTHAEQFNQNINGLSWGAANMAWKSVELFQQYLSVSLIFAIQSLDLRAKMALGHFDGSALLGHEARPLYQAVYEELDCSPSGESPFLFNDSDRWLEKDIDSLQTNICSDGSIVDSVKPVIDSFHQTFIQGV